MPVVCRTGAGKRQADGSRPDVVMSGAVDSGRESGHGNIDANDPKRTLVGPCGRLAKSFLDESDLIAQAGFGVFAVLDAALDQDRVEEGR